MSADSLTSSSREFYERTKLKLVWSVILAGGGLMMLGMCAANGGESASNKIKMDNAATDDGSVEALVGGYGKQKF